MKNISKTITSLLLRVQKLQRAEGNFVGQVSADLSFRNARDSFQTFHTSLVLNALRDAKSFPVAKKITSRGAHYLLLQKSNTWSWNYWDRDNAKSATIPDDLDDTAMALAALHSFNPTIIDEPAMVAIVNSLISAEESPGGPYNTWLLSDWKDTVWCDVDIAVNANIANFLAMKGITLPGLNAWIQGRILKNDYTSKYYGEIPILYFISAWYRGDASGILLNHVTSKLRKKSNPLETALLISAHLRLGGSTPRVRGKIHELIAYAELAIEAFPFFVEGIKAGVPQLAGSAALTAAYIAQSLQLWNTAHDQAEKQQVAARDQKTAAAIGRYALRRFRNLPDLAPTVQSLVAQLAVKDPSHEIALLPFWFAKSMGVAVPQNFLGQLGAINTLGWIGYSIVDKILDGENAQRLLPIADICIREVSIAFAKLLPDAKSRNMVSDILDTIDRTTFWEHMNCNLKNCKGSEPARGQDAPFCSDARLGGVKKVRLHDVDGLRTIPKELPDYNNNIKLAEKSLGHALGPIAIILCSKDKDKFKKAKLVQKFFTEYLIARQLNDDAHDWLQDLENGFINGASVQLLKEYVRRNGAVPPLQEGVGGVLPDRESLQKIFWHETITTVADQIRGHAARARGILRILQKKGILCDTTLLENLLTPLEQSAKQAITERDSTIRFLKAYQ